ncbi:flagellar hook-associated protein FlgK [Geodermatophilus sp. SYSU D00758]
MSSFSSLNTATTALWAQRRGLDVTGQNIANVNSEGYSRQRVDLRAMGGTVVPAFHSVSQGVGSGVSSDDVLRIRDAFLEGRAHAEHATSAQLRTESTAFGAVEDAFREPGSTGVQALLSDVWAAWGDVANNPQDLATRSQLLQRTETLVSGMHATRATLDTQWTNAHQNLQALVGEVNSIATEVAGLNRAIQRATASGYPTNELADQRDVLVMRLADQVGATVRPGEGGVLDVVVGGTTLVAGSLSTKLAVAGPTGIDTMTASDRPRVVTDPGGSAVPVGGTAAGRLTVMTHVVPTYRAGLDAVAAGFVAQVNALHRSGYDRDGNQGGDLLGPPPPATVTAGNIALLVGSPAAVVASKLPPSGGGASTDNGIADEIGQLRLATDGPDTTYRAMIVELGVQASVSARTLDIQSVVATNVDAARESVAGVNLDEEMANMLQYQHAYAAASRMVTAIDEALDVLISRTGLVGR